MFGCRFDCTHLLSKVRLFLFRFSTWLGLAPEALGPQNRFLRSTLRLETICRCFPAGVILVTSARHSMVPQRCLMCASRKPQDGGVSGTPGDSQKQGSARGQPRVGTHSWPPVPGVWTHFPGPRPPGDSSPWLVLTSMSELHGATQPVFCTVY